jgi:PPE-repeat protein
MSFVTTQPEALDYAATKLEGIGTSLAAQNTAATASTTAVAPAAADEVSALQATQFTAYGNLYQQLSAEATAIHQAFVQMLGTTADSYGATEAANSASTGAAGLGGFSILGQLTQFGQFGVIPGALSNSSMIGMFAGNPFIGSASNFAALSSASGSGSGSGGAGAASAELAGVSVAGTAPPVSAAGVGAAPVLAGVGQASAVGGLSVPPSWAPGAGVFATSVNGPATSAGWTSAAAPHGASATAVPGGVPAMASTGRTSGLGAPRYGLKPKVMPKSTIV